MLKKIQIRFIGLLLMFLAVRGTAQYVITDEVNIPCSPVKSQDRTGTCWSYSTASFLESEYQRLHGKMIDLSEMYIVRQVYLDKARNYVLRQGKANFSQGALSHDLIRTMAHAGLMTESAYTGRMPNEAFHDHSELEAGIKGYLDGVRSQSTLSDKWLSGVEALLDVYMGAVPDQMLYDGKQHNAWSFYKASGINASDYITYTSFTHHPIGSTFILEIPDNYSNGVYHNVELDKLIDLVDIALDNGYTVAWDGDVSEQGFSQQEGLAILPQELGEGMFNSPVDEIVVTPEVRQRSFENYSTTDDHLMHIVGRAIDQKGNKYYKIKNSWGEKGPYNGFLYMSEAYFKMKTVGILLHKNVAANE